MNLHPTCSSPDFPISGNGPTQLLKPKASVLLSFGLTPTSNPTIVLTPLAHLCHHSILAYNFIAWPDCSASLPTPVLAFLPFHITLNEVTKKYKSDSATPVLKPSMPQKSSPRPTRPTGSQPSSSPLNSPSLRTGLLPILWTCQSPSCPRALALPLLVTISPKLLTQIAPSHHSGLSLNTIPQKPSLSPSYPHQTVSLLFCTSVNIVMNLAAHRLAF